MYLPVEIRYLMGYLKAEASERENFRLVKCYFRNN